MIGLFLFHLLRLSMSVTWELDLPRVGWEGPGHVRKEYDMTECLDEIMEMKLLKQAGNLTAQRQGWLVTCAYSRYSINGQPVYTVNGRDYRCPLPKATLGALP